MKFLRSSPPLTTAVCALLAGCAAEPPCKGMAVVSGSIVQSQGGEAKLQLSTDLPNAPRPAVDFQGTATLANTQETYTCMPRLFVESMLRNPEMFVFRVRPNGQVEIDLKPEFRIPEIPPIKPL